MAQLKEIKIGWKELAADLNDIVVGVNENEPRSGDGINVTRMKGGGSVISLKSKENSPAFTSEQISTLQMACADPAGNQAAWQQILLASQDDTGNTFIYQMWVWGTLPYNPVPCSQKQPGS
jgi:hypothetical protein